MAQRFCQAWLVCLVLIGVALCQELVQAEPSNGLHMAREKKSGVASEEKRFDSSRWGSGSDGHLYDFVKRGFQPSRWGSGSDGHLYDFAKRFDASRWGGGSDGHLYDFAKRNLMAKRPFDASRWATSRWNS